MVLSIVALALTVAPACATTITTYTSLASWQAAASVVTLIDFENGCQTNCFGAVFTGMLGTFGVQDTSTTSWMNFGTINALYINKNSASIPTIRIVLPTPVTAFSLNGFTANPNALNLTITILSTPFTIATNPLSTPAFFGVTSDTAFTTIDISLPGGSVGTYEFIDNVRFGTAQLPTDPVPEAATFLLIGSGLIGIMALRKRIMKNKPDLRPLQNSEVLSSC